MLPVYVRVFVCFVKYIYKHVLLVEYNVFLFIEFMF